MGRFRALRAARRRGDRGAALVEFALVLPVLAVLMLGILETGFLWRDVNVAERTSSTAARTVATNTPFENAFSDYEGLRSVDAGMAGARNATVTKVIIYRSTTADGAVPPACTALSTGGVSGVCNVYNATQVATANPSGFPRGDIDNPTCVGGSWDSSWCPITRDRDPVPTADYVGVYIEATYTTFTNLFPATVTIREQAVYQLEPPIPD